jgi:hypothetical protein
LEDKERMGWMIKKGWGIGGLRKCRAFEDKERVEHFGGQRKCGTLEDKESVGHWRMKKGWDIGG